MTFFLHQATGCPRFHQARDPWQNPGCGAKHTQAELIRRQQAFARLGDANRWPRSDAFHQRNTELWEREETHRGKAIDKVQMNQSSCDAKRDAAPLTGAEKDARLWLTFLDSDSHETVQGPDHQGVR